MDVYQNNLGLVKTYNIVAFCEKSILYTVETANWTNSLVIFPRRGTDVNALRRFLRRGFHPKTKLYIVLIVTKFFFEKHRDS